MWYLLCGTLNYYSNMNSKCVRWLTPLGSGNNIILFSWTLTIVITFIMFIMKCTRRLYPLSCKSLVPMRQTMQHKIVVTLLEDTLCLSCRPLYPRMYKYIWVHPSISLLDIGYLWIQRMIALKKSDKRVGFRGL